MLHIRIINVVVQTHVRYCRFWKVLALHVHPLAVASSPNYAKKRKTPVFCSYSNKNEGTSPVLHYKFTDGENIHMRLCNAVKIRSVR